MYEKIVIVKPITSVHFINNVHANYLLMKFELYNDVYSYFAGLCVNCHHLDSLQTMLNNCKMNLTFCYRFFKVMFNMCIWVQYFNSAYGVMLKLMVNIVFKF